MKASKYGLTLLVSDDDGLQAYLSQVLGQLTEWLTQHAVQKLVLVITSVETSEVLERWTFDIEADKSVGEDDSVAARPEKEVQGEIRAIIRQITASVSFLPLLDEPTTFDLLIYTGTDISVPQAWEESDPRYIQNSDDVRLRSFTTSIHKVDSMVSYKV